MTDNRDPRTLGIGPPDDLAFANAEAGPVVARQSGALPTAFVALAVVLLGFLAFMWMSGQRTQREATPITAPVANAPQMAAGPPPVELAEPAPAYTPPAPQFTIQNTLPPYPSPQTVGPLTPQPDPNQRRRAPAMVVDLGPAPAEASTAAVAVPAGAGAQPAGAAADTDPKADAMSGIAAEDRFAARVGSGAAERVRATTLRNLDLLVPQGAVIPGVLETAINSDLPGFARAVVSRDVRGFDGTQVLIPRGSRLIGQYKSGLALGASRVFVIWTRVIRPDGVSIQIGSPGTDDLGRAGVTGQIDRHFFSRFGGSILLSVLNAGLFALSDNRPTAQVVIGSSSDATNVASSALTADQSRPPTVKTPQGSPIRIFVARDLDFSGVAKVVAAK
ncbi:MAG: hypothetical protein B7Y99_03235 [Caulobacterales bacterium 32-69-10]|nr:MAG: hypothetical protein B7Y99_03235 [Caulobacterales bacterium 32-69-10]